MSWYLEVLKKYAVFNGRARRKEYWMFVLFNFIFVMLTLVADYIVGTRAIYIIYCVAIIIPGIAVTVRRLHDIGKSGFWYFIALVPIIGTIWLIVLLCKEGQSGANEYGEDPKAM